MWEDAEGNKKEKEVQRKKKGGLCVLTVFHFHGTKASSGNTVLQLALDVIVPAEKPLSFHRGCIRIYSLTAVTDLAMKDVLYITIGRWRWLRAARFFLFNQEARGL